MAKSKNHTNHNQVAKAHKNGIKKPRRQKYLTTRMVNQKLRRNIKRSRFFDPTIKKSADLTKRIKVRITNKTKIQAAIKDSIMKAALKGAAPVEKKVAAPAPAAKGAKAAAAPKK